MTNKDRMKKTIIKDFDKRNNYETIINKIEDNHDNKKYLKFVLVPMILLVFVSVLVLNNHDNNLNRTFKDGNNVNTTSIGQDGDDYDGININQSADIIINELKEYKVKQDGSSNYLNNINIPYFDVLKDIKIPEDFDVLADGRGVCISKNNKDKDYGKINNYEFWFMNSKNNRRIVIAISDKNIPYRDFQINDSNAKKSIVNGVEVKIFKNENTYVSMFNYKGYNIDIETSEINEKEHISLLSSIIK